MKTKYAIRHEPKETGLRGFASLVAGVGSQLSIPTEHVGITDPRIAPSDGHEEVWEHFGITAEALVVAVKEVAMEVAADDDQPFPAPMPKSKNWWAKKR